MPPFPGHTNERHVLQANLQHTVSCLHYYNNPGYRFAPKVGELIDDWNDFEMTVEKHSSIVNQGAKLDTTRGNDRCRVTCGNAEDLGCRYSFTARFLVDGLHEGRVEVTRVSDQARSRTFGSRALRRLISSIVKTVWSITRRTGEMM